MRRTYELALVLDPGLSDDEQGVLVDEVKRMVSTSGVAIAREESWGKRKLAFPIGKASEGRYVFLYITADEAAPPFQEVEKRLNQNERVLRYLTVRTDEDLRRALRKGKRPPLAAEAVGMAPARPAPEAPTREA
jgi:small subunit ribosomal protein S6